MTTTLTPAAPKPIEIVIEAVQFTPDRDPVLIQYSGKGALTGPFSKPQQHHTTQTALVERMAPSVRAALEAAGLDPVNHWGLGEEKAELLAHLTEHGIYAEIVPNVDPPQPEEPVQPTRLEAAASQ